MVSISRCCTIIKNQQTLVSVLQDGKTIRKPDLERSGASGDGATCRRETEEEKGLSHGDIDSLTADCRSDNSQALTSL